MKTFIILFTLLLVRTGLTAQQQNDHYQYRIDLLHMQQDQVMVSFTPPKNKLKKANFIMPKLVPGYYDAMNFGQYISNFKAFDKAGREISVSKIDTNTWQIADLEHTERIVYKVSDGWDKILQPTGGAKSPASMFRKDSVAIVNYNALTGYFQEIKTGPYKITVIKNKDFYASSALKYKQINDTTDCVLAPDYRRLVDSPVLYCAPDTSWINLGNSKILVSFYSTGVKEHAMVLAKNLKTILENQRAYLGGKLPVKDYAFLIYHESIPQAGLIGDGLEHSNSTVCLYATKLLDHLPQALIGVASHEFFHILTPLNIHSREIQEFNFLNPVLSKHLWLYEGMTEYATIHMPIKQHTVGLTDFLRTVSEKIKGMQEFDNSLSMTAMSSQAVQRQDQYMNFYQKGALIGMCLDIRLRELSQGKSGTQKLMTKLSKKYGPEKSFKDDELFDVIAALSAPEIRRFFRDYVENAVPIPLKESLNKVGLDYDEPSKTVVLLSAPSPSQLALRKSWIAL